MDRNVRLLVLVSLLFGYASGAYEVVFPLYLDWIGVSFRDMGILFGVTAAAIALLNVAVGSKSDVVGRKAFYALSLALCGIVNFLVPFFRRLWEVLLLSIGQSASASIRNAVHNVLLFELTRKAFISAYSKVNGMEYFAQALGLLGAGLILASMSFQSAFMLSFSVLLAALVLFSFGFKEERPEMKLETRDCGSGVGLPRELKIFAVSGLVMAVGFGCSHGFITPLFFAKKFGADNDTVSLILTIHRLCFAVPLIFADKVLHLLRRFSSKSVIVALMAYQGISISVASLIPDLPLAAAVFVSHDLLAAAFWSPAQSALIQSYCRNGSRGADSSKVGSISSIGSVASPFLAGFLASLDISYPLMASGIITLLAALALLPI
ncbi:MAG: MFS transporter [Candidatus Brockarchaeota archaeon]|nr:MFS transporter [Candidatus Brockarchaeota archaeon]